MERTAVFSSITRNFISEESKAGYGYPITAHTFARVSSSTWAISNSSKMDLLENISI